MRAECGASTVDSTHWAFRLPCRHFDSVRRGMFGTWLANFIELVADRQRHEEDKSGQVKVPWNKGRDVELKRPLVRVVAARVAHNDGDKKHVIRERCSHVRRAPGPLTLRAS